MSSIPLRYLSVLIVLWPCAVAGGQSKPTGIAHQIGLVTWSWNTPSIISEQDDTLAYFVHRLPASWPGAPLRLNRAITYFHPPLNTTEPLVVNVNASFKGGILSDYYPYALNRVNGAKTLPQDLLLTSATVSNIDWTALRIGDQADPFETSCSIWTAARAVGMAAPLKVYKPGPPGSVPDDPGTTEGEVYLFYKGSGVRVSPLLIKRMGSVLEISPQLEGWRYVFGSSWLVHMRADGTGAFSHLGVIDPQTSPILEVPVAFAADKYGSNAPAELMSQVREALNAEGLHDDEAAALLAMAELSHFRAPGMRLLFLLPRSWVDEVLPVSINGPASVEKRVFLASSELTWTKE